MRDEKAEEGLLSILLLVEEDTSELGDLHADVCAALDGIDGELLYLVRGSASNALARALELAETDPDNVRVLRFAASVDGASMLRAGLETARGELVLTLPGEFDADLSDLGRLREAIAAGADLAIGSRSAWKDAAARVQSRIFSRLLSRVGGATLGDVTSRTRLLRRHVALDLPMYGEFHRYLPMLAHRAGFRVVEIPVRQHQRARLATTFRPSAYLWRVFDLLSLFFLSRFTRHPLRLFGGVGGAVGLLGFGVLAFATFQRMFFGVGLADRPVLVLGTLLLGLGVQVFTIGLLGELILFVHGRGSRQYRVGEVIERSPPPLPPGASSFPAAHSD